MNPSRFLKLLLIASFSASLVASASIDRPIEKTFPTKPHAKLLVDISGGSITVKVGGSGQIELKVDQTLNASSESEADKILEDYEITTEIDGNTVKFITKSKRSWWSGGLSGWKLKQKFHATVPADTVLDLDTSGGSITIEGKIDGDVRADTSGGSISVGDGTGYLNLDTSGGSITVGRALGKLRADTSGGSIRVAYIGPDASDVNCDTSGGSIRIGVDPAGNFDLNADTSGGRVQVEGLTFTATKLSKTHASGRINNGGARLRADTSGGSITISAAKD